MAKKPDDPKQTGNKNRSEEENANDDIHFLHYVHVNRFGMREVFHDEPPKYAKDEQLPYMLRKEIDIKRCKPGANQEEISAEVDRILKSMKEQQEKAIAREAAARGGYDFDNKWYGRDLRLATVPEGLTDTWYNSMDPVASWVKLVPGWNKMVESKNAQEVELNYAKEKAKKLEEERIKKAKESKERLRKEMFPTKNMKHNHMDDMDDHQEEEDSECMIYHPPYKPSDEYRPRRVLCNVCNNTTEEFQLIEKADRIAFFNRLQLPPQQIQELYMRRIVRVCYRHYHPSGVALMCGTMFIVDATYLINETPPAGWPNKPESSKKPELAPISPMTSKVEPEDFDYRRSEMTPREESTPEKNTYKLREKKSTATVATINNFLDQIGIDHQSKEDGSKKPHNYLSTDSMSLLRAAPTTSQMPRRMPRISAPLQLKKARKDEEEEEDDINEPDAVMHESRKRINPSTSADIHSTKKSRDN